MTGTEAADLAHCRAAIRTGSLSFHAASRLLPNDIRDPALVLYAFCRLADDEVDEGEAKEAAVLALAERLDAAYAGRPQNAPEDRAFARIVERHEMPRALPEALLEGLAWDAAGRRYEDLSGLRAYSARVASAVGVMMCVLMDVRDAHALARAADLGVAMQLTNIARDVGEDARAGRLYLPQAWMDEVGVTEEDLRRGPGAGSRLLTARLLRTADKLYLRAEAGIPALPRRARAGIWAARLIYAGIGGAVRAQDLDNIAHRARTTKARKIGWIAEAGIRTAGSLAMPRSAVLYAPPLPETTFLVDAAAREARPQGRTSALLDVLADLAARDTGGTGPRGQGA